MSEQPPPDQPDQPKLPGFILRTEEAGGAPFLYIEGVQGHQFLHNVIKLNLFQDLPPYRPVGEDEKGYQFESRRKIVATIGMDINAFHSFIMTLQRIFDDAVKQGVVLVEEANVRRTAGQSGRQRHEDQGDR